MTERQTIDTNSPLGWIITMVTMAGISTAWFFVMVKFWPYHPAIGWTLFAIPVSITVLLPLMFVIRKIQEKRRKGRTTSDIWGIGGSTQSRTI